MPDWHGYFAIEDINMTAQQRQELLQVLKSRGKDNFSPFPQFRNHWRISLDGTKAIFEALFDSDQLTIDHFKLWLGNIFNVDPLTIDHNTMQITFVDRPTPIATFSRGGTNYIRFALFAGLGATWPESRTEVRAYFLQNLSEWENEI